MGFRITMEIISISAAAIKHRGRGSVQEEEFISTYCSRGMRVRHGRRHDCRTRKLKDVIFNYTHTQQVEAMNSQSSSNKTIPPQGSMTYPPKQFH